MAQAVHLLEKLWKFTEKSQPIIICGDLNSQPDSSALKIFDYQGDYTATKEVEEKNLMWYESMKKEFLARKGTYKKRFGVFSNAYAKYSKDGFPEYTCFVKDFQGCLDHILYNNKIKCAAVLETPTKQELSAENGAIPSTRFPSDHVRI